MVLSEKEIESVSSMEAFKRYQYLIKRIADSEKVYTLQDGYGNEALSILNESKLVPIWSAEEYAAKSTVGAWANFHIVEVYLDDFLEMIIEESEIQDFLLNTFPVDDGTGFLVRPSMFARDIQNELTQYE